MTLNAAEKGRFYGWINLTVGAIAFLVMSGALMFSLGVFLPFLCKEFEWSRGSVSMAMTVSMLVMGLSSPLAGMIISKYGARAAIVVGSPLGALGLFLLAFHNHLWELYLGFGVLCGLGSSIGGMLAISTVINNWFVKKRSLAISIIMAASGLGGLVMFPLTMLLINTVGWRHAYLILSVVALVFCAIFPGIFIKNKPEDLGQAPDGTAESIRREAETATPGKGIHKTPVDFTLKEAIRTPAMWLIVGFFSMQLLALQGVMTHQVAFLLDIGISSGMAAVAMGLLSAAGTVSRLSVGFLGLRYNMQFLAIGSMAFSVAGMILILFTRSMPMVYLYSVVLGIGTGGTFVAMMTLVPNYFGPTDYPKIVGLSMPFSTVISCLGAPLAGFIRDATGRYTSAFQLFVFILIAATVCVILARPPVHPSLRQGPSKGI